MDTILVTGANRGIGLEFTKQYASAGYLVVATCRRPEKATELVELASLQPTVSIVDLDVSSDLSIQELEKTLVERDAVIDLLISNAGILVDEPYGSWTSNSFSDTMRTNVIGPAILAQSLDSVLSGSAKVIQLSSRLGSLELGGKGMVAGDSYAVSKSALNMLTVRLASVYQGSKRIAVSMSPGWVATDMGGAGAPLTAEASVAKMIPTIEALTVSDSGRFIDNEGNTLSW